MFQKVLKKVVVSLLLVSATAISGVEIGGTRLVYNGSGQQAAISVSNPDNTPYLIQSWVSNSENSDDGDSVFITTPPLFKLNPHAQNSVRVMLTDNTVPQDRESVYWLNIKSIPSSSADAKNALLIAVKSKMKIFYRPAGLKGDPSLAYQQLTFSTAGGKLNVHNPSPYSVSLYDVKVNGKELEKPPMVLPFQTVSLSQAAVTGGEVSWRAINDFGGITAEHKFKI
ncbi:molecular chaperone [Klebsiella sp. 2680]|uniref:fimbrial biogenesis chaperone n=1 Tax=Klebsiella sp. 2680 TaxID=2018037 RepID=UPI001159B070|nr:molecular chaperone [Klebsiella sp. 2680]